MRVLFITNTFPPGYTGGAEVANYHTCRGLTRHGIGCSVLVVNNRMPWPVNKWYEVDGIPVHLVNFTTFWRHAWGDVLDWRVYRTVEAELRRLKPDLVHIQNVSGATLAPYLACRRRGLPTVNTLHDLWLLCPNNMLYRSDGSFCDPRRHPHGCRDCFRRYDFWADIPYRRAVFAMLMSNVKVFISMSQGLINRHVEAGYPAQRFRLIRFGPEASQPRRSNSPKVNTIDSTAHQHRMVIFAGGGIEIKGANVLLEAIPSMLLNIRDLRIVIAGGGEDRLLAKFGEYAPAVSLLGQIPFREMHYLFTIADLTLVPSVCHENASMVISESYQSGTPVAGSAFGGIPELIHHGETGYLFPLGNAAALAETVISHFALPAHARRRMRQNCVREARTHLDFNKYIEEILQVYAEVLGG